MSKKDVVYENDLKDLSQFLRFGTKEEIKKMFRAVRNDLKNIIKIKKKGN